jgi:hypothetical protein
MSRAGVSRTLVGAVALVALIAVASCTQTADQESLLDAVAPSVDSVHINFSCGPVDSLALADKNGRPAWSFSRRPNDPITWVVPQNVTINSLKGRTANDNFPVDSTGPQGGAPGTAFHAKVKGGAAQGTYHYVINATCTAGADTIRLLIDPELIIRPH